MNKPSKKFWRLWPYHARDLLLNSLTFVLSLGRPKQTADEKAKQELHWHEELSNVAVGPSSFANHTFTILSWNVFKGFFEHQLVGAMHELIQQHSPDAVAFQEAPMYANGTFLEWPPEFVPISQVYVSSQKKIPGVYEFEHTGELTAARMPHLKASFHLFPKVTYPQFQGDTYLHRNFVYTQWQTRSGTLGLYNVHLESVSTPLKRLAEVKELYEVIEQNDDDITVIAGDFNTISGPLEPALQFLHRKGFVNGFKPGLKQLVPRLDHIFVRGAKGIKTTVFPRIGSDHKPSVAKIQL